MSDIANVPARGQDYWRSLQELADTDEFRQQLDHEFPAGIEAPGGLSRRRFLQIMSASVALTSLAGCRWPVEKIVPFAKRPAGYAPGTPVQFATTFELGPVAHGVLATSYDGRPIKIDGNPGVDLSGGATSAIAQASVLDLYDPDRSRTVISRQGRAAAEADWATFSGWAGEHFAGLRKSGAGLAILSGATSSPSVRGLLDRAAQTYPGARTYLWEPVCRQNEILGVKEAFGQPALAQLDLERAAVIVDFDANLLQDHATALRNNRQFAAGRRPESGHMNRLYCWENTFSTTGGMADHRFPTAARDIGPAVWALTAELVLGEGLPLPLGSGVARGELLALAWTCRRRRAPGRGGPRPDGQPGQEPADGRHAPARVGARAGPHPERGPGQRGADHHLPAVRGAGRRHHRGPGRATWTAAASTRWSSSTATRSTPRRRTWTWPRPWARPGTASTWATRTTPPAASAAGTCPRPTTWRAGATPWAGTAPTWRCSR